MVGFQSMGEREKSEEKKWVDDSRRSKNLC
jgi:hypothetical protein